MRQQVNLYQPIFRKEKKLFSAGSMLAVLAVVLIALTALSGYSFWQGHRLERQLAVLEQQRDAQTRHLAEAAARLTPPARDMALDEEVARLREEVALRQRLLTALGDRKLGGADGFSEHLAGLSRQRTPLLWLRRVELRQGGTELNLMGSSLNAEQVPLFIEQLGREPAFRGSRFRIFSIQRADENKPQVDFVLRSREADEEGEEAS